MSHQTGIKASEDLKAFLSTAKDGHVRVIKIGIENEELVFCDKGDAAGTWEEDYDNVVKPLLDKNDPCYLFYRLDTREEDHSYDWALLHYVPDDAKVRQKMLYASTKATMKSEFGGGLVKDEVFGTKPEDILLEGYKKHKIAESAPPPLSMKELELEEIKKSEDRTEINTNTKHQTLTGLLFPVEERAMDRIEAFAQNEITYVQMSINVEEEVICLEDSGDVNAKTLLSRVPEDQGSYHMFMYKHTHEGDYMETPVFIYIVPGYQCSIKERMLYSSVKGPLTQYLESLISSKFIKVVEVDTPSSELTEESLYDHVHPKKTIYKPKFAKPKGPAGRAPRRKKPTTQVEQNDDD